MNMDEVKRNCNGWVDYAYDNWLLWLRRERPEEFYLRESTQILVGRMRDILCSDEEAWNLLGRLKKLGSGIHNMQDDFGGNKFLYEQAEINLECAIAAYRMGDYHEASTLLDMTVGSFHGRSIHRAISCWIHSCIQWQSQSHFDLALVNWEKSSRIVTELSSNSSFDQSFANECMNITMVMNNAILEASRLGYPPPPPNFSSTHTSNTARPHSRPSTPGAGPMKSKAGSSRSSRLRGYSVLGCIPAGAPAEIVDDSTEESFVDRLEINSYYYRIHSVKTGMEINLTQNGQYFILRVNGDSMNKALPVNIESGDYVLVVKQNVAMSGDIVAAEINGVDVEATLKRYSFRNNEHTLTPESDNPANIHMTYKKDFSIRGVVVAVLKRDDA